MSHEPSASDPLRADHFHPVIYKLLLVLLIWMTVAAWGFFGGDEATGLALGIVTVFALVTAMLLLAVARLRRRSGEMAEGRTESGSFRDWAARDFATWQGRLRGSDAAILALLPILAVAGGMTAFVLVFLLTPASGA